MVTLVIVGAIGLYLVAGFCSAIATSLMRKDWYEANPAGFVYIMFWPLFLPLNLLDFYQESLKAPLSILIDPAGALVRWYMSRKAKQRWYGDRRWQK